VPGGAGFRRAPGSDDQVDPGGRPGRDAPTRETASAPARIEKISRRHDFVTTAGSRRGGAAGAAGLSSAPDMRYNRGL